MTTEEVAATAAAAASQEEQIALTEDQGVLKRILVQAPADAESPAEDDEVSVHYVGTLLDGTKFDSSRDRNEPFKFKLGAGQVIKGWDIGVASMKKGEKAVLTCKPEYAYGKAGSPPKIPANATLQFEVELLSWQSDNDLTGDGGILKKLLKKGEGDKKPYTGYEVTVHYVARLADGAKVFDSTREKGEPLTFLVSEDDSVPEFLHRGVKEMKKGDLLQLTVAPSHAFGAQGHQKLGVPPNATVIYEVELLELHQVDRLLDGAVIKKKLKEGSGYKRPNDGSRVQVKLTARVQGQEPFLVFAEPQHFTLGAGELPEAVEAALAKMDKEEVALLTVNDSDYFFAEEENRRRQVPVGRHKFLVEVELVDFEKTKETWEMDFAEKMETSKRDKEAGNAHFKLGRFRQAKAKYKKALSSLESDYKFTDEEKKQAKEFRLSLYLNMAAVKLKMADFKEVIQNCNKALEIDKENVKALFRRAQAKQHQGDFEGAKKDLLSAAHISPTDKDVRLLLKEIDAKIKAMEQKEKKVFSGMFEKLSQMEEKEAKKIKKDEGTSQPAPEPVKMEE